MFERKKPSGKLLSLPIDQIHPSPFQARKSFDEQELTALAQSIRENGLLQPVTVRRAAEGYELVAGERRLRACQLAKMTTIPAILCSYADDRTAALGLLENIQRADLNPFEQAQGLRDVMVLWDCTQAEAAKRLGMAPSNVHAYILGEHGDSSFVPWIHCYLGCKNLLEYIDEEDNLSLEDLQNIYLEVRNAAYEIIDRKKATYYGIGLALKRLVSCLLNDEKAILTVSTYQNGEYGREGYYIGVPAVVGNNGVEKIIRLSLNEMDQNKFNNSFDTLKATIEENLQEVLADLN